MRCGDICLAHYPFTDASAAKLRPVLVISADRFNSGADLVVLPISSRPDADDPYSIYIDSSSPQFSRSGLRYPSAVKWTKPLTVSKALLNRKLGHLSGEFLDNVRTNLKSMFS